MKKAFLLATCLYLFQDTLFPQAPDYYSRVDHLVWIVGDLKTVKKNWQLLGFNQITDLGEATVVSTFDGKSESFTAKLAVAWLADLKVLWIQPKGRTNVFGEYLRLHQDGVFSIVHSIDDKKTLKEEAARLKKDDVSILGNIEMKTKNGRLSYFFFNTEPDGKYILGFTFTDVSDNLFRDENNGENQYGFVLKQLAFAIKQDIPVSDFWVKLGLPEFKTNRVPVGQRTYYSDSASFEINISRQQLGTVDYEWYIPLKGPSIYDDHLSLHGEGLDHINFTVTNPEKVILDLIAKGFIISQSGKYDEKVKANSGMFYDIDSKMLGGIGIEITSH